MQGEQHLGGNAAAAGSISEQEGSSEDCSPSGDLAPVASLAASPGITLPALAGLPGLNPHEEESRRAQEYWKRAAQPYAIGDTPRLGSSGPHVSLSLHVRFNSIPRGIAIHTGRM